MMREFRVLLILAVFGGLGIFAVQNASPVLPIVFLGTQSLALPLSVLILGAAGAGVLTSIVIGGLFKLSNYVVEQELLTRRHIPLPQIPREYMPETPREPVPPPPRRQPEPAPQANTVLQNNWTPTTSPTDGTTEEPMNRRANFEEQDDYDESVDRRAGIEENDDYDEPAEDDDEFYEEWEENERQADRSAGDRDLGKDRTTYEVPQEPKTVSRYGSTYSIGYRDSAEPGVGNTESVYDADYRVINAPSSGEPAPKQDERTQKPTQDEDWDWDDDKRKPSKDW